MQRTEQEFRRWSAFFYPLIDKPEQAQSLCEVGLRVSRRRIQAGAEARTAVERILRPSPNQ